jgi:hypothetical protein
MDQSIMAMRALLGIGFDFNLLKTIARKHSNIPLVRFKQRAMVGFRLCGQISNFETL